MRQDEVSILADKIRRGERISPQEALLLYERAPLAMLGELAAARKTTLWGDKVFYNRNFHIEPTNRCAFNCRFCSFRRASNQEGVWDWSLEQIEQMVALRASSGATEIHVVGGVHPEHDLYYYVDMIGRIKRIMPHVTVKAFTAIELAYMIRKAGLSLDEGLSLLQEAGMEAMAGGGAEIFDSQVRGRICPEKGTAEEWLEVHAHAHRLGIPTNATMLYGHIETPEQRIDHLDRLRRQQDLTGGFNAFIPLKYRSEGNSMGAIGEVPVTEDLRTLALSRIYLDNFPHIKAYWVMWGRTTTELALSFGADDIDGTIEDSTRIYSLAGAEEQHPQMSVGEIESIIRAAGCRPVERDTFYNEIKQELSYGQE